MAVGSSINNCCVTLMVYNNVTHDKAGNRLTETVKNTKESVTTVYTYNEQNRLTKTVANKGGETERIVYRYDANGNMLSKEQSIT